MKILLVSNMYPSEMYPHYGVFVQNAEKILGKLPNTQVDKVVMCKHYIKIAKLFDYLRFYTQILCKGIFGGYDVIYGHFLSHIAIPLRIVKFFRPKCKLVLNAHGNDVVADVPGDRKWIRLSRMLIPCADHIIVPSEYFRQVMKREFGVPAEKLFVYPSGGVDREVFYPRDREEHLNHMLMDTKKRYIGYVSRVEADKGWDTFLEMVCFLADRKDLGFIFVGAGAEEPALRKMLVERKLTTTVTTFDLQPQDEVAKLFSVMEIFCFPTRRKSESLGLVGLEAMACGTTVVASNAYGPSSYMRDRENGFTFRAGDAEDLTRAVNRALYMTDIEKERVRAGMAKTVAAYSRENLDQKLLDFFANL